MTFNKISGHVGFEEASHTYTNMKTGERYTSVTTLLSKFKPKFNGQYWATYKACKDIMESEGIWRAYKNQAGNWEKVVDHFNNTGLVNLKTPTLDAIFKVKKQYLNKWEQEGRIANEKGSKIHDDLEKAAHHSRILKQKAVNHEVTEEDILEIQDFTSNKCYPELMIYNDEYKLSGQCDQVFKEGKYVDIEDYKTYKKLEYEGFRGETCLEPIAHLQNANYWGTALQLSLYGWMLEELGYEVRSLKMHWVHGEDENDKERNAGVRTYEMPYLKEDIIRILNYKQ